MLKQFGNKFSIYTDATILRETLVALRVRMFSRLAEPGIFSGRWDSCFFSYRTVHLPMMRDVCIVRHRRAFMKSTIAYGGQKICVDIISFPPESASTIPPAGLHPVVQARGKMLRLHSPVELAIGTSFSLESDDDIPYGVRVQNCFGDGHGKFYIVGIIGE